MEELDLSLTILSDIIDNDVQFNEALRKVFQADIDKRPMRSSVAGLVGCELRHALLFEELTASLADYSIEEKRFLSLALGDLFFVRRIPSETIIDALKTRLGEAKLAEAQPLIDKAGKPETYIPVDLQKSSNRYLSLRYNTPEWVLKIWEHYGFGTTYKILKKNNRPLVSSVRVRSVISSEELLNNNHDYAKGPVENMLTYAGKVPLRKLPEFHEGKVFLEKFGTKALLDAHKVSEPSEVFLYNGNADSSIIKELVESYGSSVGLNIGVKDTAKYADVSYLIKSMGLKNVNFFGAAPDAMDAAISRPQDLVIAAPDSSNFDLIREYPDYLLHFKKEGMDALIEQEKAVLEGTSKFVAENGMLIYVIYTISKKEGHGTVSDFLLAHNDFQLVEEKQEFPFEDLDTSIYYAILHKGTPIEKVGVPLGVLANEKLSPSVSLGAKAKEEPVKKEMEKAPEAKAQPKPEVKEEKPAEKVEEATPIEEATNKEEDLKVEAAINAAVDGALAPKAR